MKAMILKLMNTELIVPARWGVLGLPDLQDAPARRGNKMNQRFSSILSPASCAGVGVSWPEAAKWMTIISEIAS